MDERKPPAIPAASPARCADDQHASAAEASASLHILVRSHDMAVLRSAIARITAAAEDSTGLADDMPDALADHSPFQPGTVPSRVPAGTVHVRCEFETPDPRDAPPPFIDDTLNHTGRSVPTIRRPARDIREVAAATLNDWLLHTPPPDLSQASDATDATAMFPSENAPHPEAPTIPIAASDPRSTVATALVPADATRSLPLGDAGAYVPAASLSTPGLTVVLRPFGRLLAVGSLAVAAVVALAIAIRGGPTTPPAAAASPPQPTMVSAAGAQTGAMTGSESGARHADAPSGSPDYPAASPAPDSEQPRAAVARARVPLATGAPLSQPVAARVEVPAARAAAPARPAQAASGTATFVGTLDVTSTPPGASVFLNNRLVGTTPLVLAECPAGTHAIRVDLAGFERWSRAILVGTGQRARVDVTLRKRIEPDAGVVPPGPGR